MPDTHTEAPADHGRLGSEEISAVADMSDETIFAELDQIFTRRAADDARVVVRLGEVSRRQSYRAEGATSAAQWAVERFGISTHAARLLMRVAEEAWNLPHLVGALRAGEISFDKVRALVDVATPETDAELRDRACERSVRELSEIARTTARRTQPVPSAQSDYEGRYLRFNDRFRTITAQFPAESYAATKTRLEDLARTVPTDGETPWDQRLFDGFTGLIYSSAPGAAGQATTANSHFVVVHVPMATLVDDAIEPTALAGELEHDGFIDRETVQRIACDATIAVAVDDDLGHTMYEGRARRNPTDAQRREVMRRDRHCRFPGCTNVTFTNVHHVIPWEPGGTTDLDNLVLMCLHHHHVVHSTGWTVTGSPNEELHIVGPSGRTMISRPSARWTGATTDSRAGPPERDRDRSAAAAP